MKKTVSKRFKVTKKAKVLHRKKGLGHFKVNKSSKQLGRKKGYVNASKAMNDSVRKNKNM